MDLPAPPGPSDPGDLMVRLLRTRNEFYVQPLYQGKTDARFAPCRLPLLPSALLHFCGGLGRALWSQDRSQMLLLLVLDLATGTWSYAVPSQRCGDWGVCCRVVRENLPELTPTMRVVGSVWSGVSPEMHPTELERHVPALDGLHFLVDPQLLWLHAMSCVRCEGRLLHVPSEQLIWNEHANLLPALRERLQILPAC